MLTTCQEIQNLEDLREYVNETICHHEQLEIGAFEMTQRILTRGGRPCGIYFCVHGPRQVKLSAIWESERNTVLFYGSDGERFQKTQLLDGPSLEVQPLAA
jgi:hypothetical protein